LSQQRRVVLEPRKSPVQARSTTSVQAILEATIQVLLDQGKERLTTTRVAQRAGVSIGTLYQYFPNKSALLQAALRNHLESVAEAVEDICRQERGSNVAQMLTSLVNTFLEAKMKDLETSLALYSVSSDVDGWRIARETGARVNEAIVSMLSTAPHPMRRNPEVVASLVQSAMNGVSRKLLESTAPGKEYQPLRQELLLMINAYVDTICVEPSEEASSVRRMMENSR
jgi:AcrR family transcriptional regulator